MGEIKNLYTFTTQTSSYSNVFQIEANSQIDAIELWYEEIITKKSLKGVDFNLLKQKLKSLKLSTAGINVWYFIIEINNIEIYVHFVLTSNETEPYYNTNEAPVFIFNKLSDLDKNILTQTAISEILETCLQYYVEMGYAKTIEEDEDVYIVYNDNCDDIDDEDMLKYMQLDLLKKGQNIPIDLIDLVLELDGEYMKSVGIYDEDDKITLLDLEFNKFNDN